MLAFDLLGDLDQILEEVAVSVILSVRLAVLFTLDLLAAHFLGFARRAISLFMEIRKPAFAFERLRAMILVCLTCVLQSQFVNPILLCLIFVCLILGIILGIFNEETLGDDGAWVVVLRVRNHRIRHSKEQAHAHKVKS